MTPIPNNEPWQLIMGGDLASALFGHLFPGDDDEHGAVVAAGVVRTPRGVRLLARELFVAVDGVDFVPSRRAYKRLTPEFVNEKIRFCRDRGLAYLAVHNHRGTTSVEFSTPDMASHERGYPALLDIGRGVPVGALVFAADAVAGDIWTPDRARRTISEAVVIERNLRRMYPSRRDAPLARRAIDDRQARIYGDEGQDLLGRLKVGVLGAGGIGMPIVAHLARLGVGHIVVIDPDRVEISNLPRLPEATSRDAMAWLTAEGRPAWLRRFGRRLATPKVRLARRIARRARRSVTVEGYMTDVADPRAARALVDCDFLFCAADTHQARAVFNAIVHQFLVPGVQVGSKVSVDAATGDVGKIFSVVRPVTPDSGCLWCNGLIDPGRLTDEGLSEREREAQRYLPRADAPAPSVIALNARGVADATNHFLLFVSGLLKPSTTAGDYRRFECRTEELRTEIPRRSGDCIDCSLTARSVRARGDNAQLPVRR